MKKKNIGSPLVIILIIIYLLIPLVVTIIYSLFEKWTAIVPVGFTVENYVALFADKEFLATLGRTLLLCIIPIVATIIMVLLAVCDNGLFSEA